MIPALDKADVHTRHACSFLKKVLSKENFFYLMNVIVKCPLYCICNTKTQVRRGYLKNM